MSEAGTTSVSSIPSTGFVKARLSSITRKQIVGLTGIGLSVFVMIHMAGNMLVFVSPQAYNEYGHKLTSTPLIYAAELGLVAFFLFHAFYASFLSWRNWRARPERYAVRASGEKRTPWVHRTLFVQGLILFVFVILHLATFKYGPHYSVNYGAGEIRDLYRNMVEVFSQPWYVAWYLVALLVLCFHLSHGVSSTFQTLGFSSPKFKPAVRWFGRIYAVVVGFGFISQPVYIFFFRG